VKSDICRVAQGPVDQPTGQRNCFLDCVAFRGSPRVFEDEDEDTDGTAGEKRIVNVAIRGFDNEKCSTDASVCSSVVRRHNEI